MWENLTDHIKKYHPCSEKHFWHHCDVGMFSYVAEYLQDCGKHYEGFLFTLLHVQ